MEIGDWRPEIGNWPPYAQATGNKKLRIGHPAQKLPMVKNWNIL